MTSNVYQIVRRAYGSYTVVEMFEGNLSQAILRSMDLQAERQDGEYMEFAADETPCQRPAPYGQSGLDWL